MWEKVLFLRGTLRFHFKPDQRVSDGICPFWNMMRINSWVFEFFWKNEISSHMAVEYAPQPKNEPKIFLGENCFWSKSAAQNAENLDFFAFFESFHFQLHHTPKWAKSDRNSLIWFKLKSERWFWFFIFFEDEKKSGRYAHGFGRHIKNVAKKFIFFSCPNTLPKAPKTHFLSFLGKNKSNRKWHDFFSLKTAKNLTWERFWIPTLYVSQCKSECHFFLKSDSGKWPSNFLSNSAPQTF